MIPVLDIFAGPGGLGEGFSASLRDGGTPAFQIRLSIEKEEFAHQTLQLRSFFRQFAPGAAPDQYYAALRREITTDRLYEQFPIEAGRAKELAWLAELGKTPWKDISERIQKAITPKENWVLIGGPPCQAYSLVGRARRKRMKKHRPEDVAKSTLYREYLRIIAHHWPAVFVMENVKGLLSHKEKKESLFEQILDDLRDPAQACFANEPGTPVRRHTYRILSLVQKRMFGEDEAHDFVVRAEETGVPQARHRIILLGVRNDLGPVSPKLLPKIEPIPISRVLAGLPRLRSGISKCEDDEEKWKDCLLEGLSRRWLLGAGRKGGADVQLRIIETVTNLTLPRHDRGAAFVECIPRCEYEPWWFIDSRIGGVCNHETRSHIVADLHRYLYASCFAKCHGRSPRLDDFPPDLLPKHENVEEDLDSTPFKDRFKVQLWDAPGSTVTCHISKDGHYYIHPDPTQCRSLTVREAARIQTFPDNYLFMGPRTEQYIQVGNAVPPLLATKIAEVVRDLFVQSGLA